MKIQCNACEAAEAKVLCCADEAALCWDCDHKVHAANKLARKHQRVPLLSAAASDSSRVPTCDICKEASGYFFCLEDRALLCRKCDIAVHTVNPYVLTHQRFLLTGVRVGLELAEPIVSSGATFSEEQLSSAAKFGGSGSTSSNTGNPPTTFSVGINKSFSSQKGLNGDPTASKAFFPSASMGGSVMSDWPLDEFFRFTDVNQGYGFPESESYKADSGKLGGSPPYWSMDEDGDGDQSLSQVPDGQWTVPEIPSPPTASGLNWQRNLHHHTADDTMFVPEICSSPNTQKVLDKSTACKRTRLH